ncbi:MAG: hypothetical protein R3B38_00145 [Patescibacteria group bacterium]
MDMNGKATTFCWQERTFFIALDYYQEKFGKKPEIGTQEEVAEIISWNIFQMDGLRYVVPMSCRKHARVIFSKATLFGNEQSHIEEIECEGCKKGILYLHNGIYVKIMNWDLNKPILFTDLLFKPLQFVGSTMN